MFVKGYNVLGVVWARGFLREISSCFKFYRLWGIDDVWKGYLRLLGLSCEV